MSDDCTDHDHDYDTERAPPGIHERVSSLEASRRTWGWIVGLIAPAVFALMIWCADKVQSSAEHIGATRATLDGLKVTMTLLDADIRELRARLLKLSGVDEQPAVGVVAVGAP